MKILGLSSPSTIQVEMLSAALLNARCAFVYAMSYRAEIFLIEPYGTEGKEVAESQAHGACNARLNVA
jgi:hypothetical protein